MFSKKAIKTSMALLLAAAVSSTALEAYAYVPTSQDTKVAPEKAEYTLEEFTDYTLLYETSTVRYYYREDRDIIAVEDKESGYCIKTGADLPFSKVVKDEVEDLVDAGASVEEIAQAAERYADDLNSTYVGIANSLLTIEFYESDKIKYISSASDEDVESTLVPLGNDGTAYRLDVQFTKPDIYIPVYITLGESSITYDIPAEEMSGSGLSKLAAVDISPFLGASGGRMNVFNTETLEWETEDAYRTPGYVLVPDGSGSLIRFVDNTASFNPYVGDVYGADWATETYYDYHYQDNVPVSDPVMPVFGIAHGDGQVGFVAWADEGAEYMDIVVNPDETKGTTYTWAYPRFEYNINYYQLYDENGSGFFTQMDELFSYNINMTYSFLFGDGSDGSPAADYTGMAKTYRQHLLETGDLTLMADDGKADVPIRLDFIMGDAESGLLGMNQVTTTTTGDVRDILNTVMETGITNINSGLVGWQKKGETLNRPNQMRFSWSVGTQNDFKKLMQEFAELDVEISYERDMISINREMTSYYNTAVKGISDWYIAQDKGVLLPESIPFDTFGFATPKRAASWLTSLADKVSSYSNGLTVTGITSVLTSNYTRGEAETTLTEAIELYREAFAQVAEEMSVNMENPNMYLWKYADRYLQMPVGSSQFIYETDSVPFLQMVLAGTMELYAPYSNFSFYTQDCILRMIDYNMSPSFILSREPSWKLGDTFSADLYSTEFTLYEDLIQNIYGQVNEVMSQVKGYEWTDRAVPANGIVINTYAKDGKTAYVVINYTETPYTYQGVTVAAESAVAVTTESSRAAE